MPSSPLELFVTNLEEGYGATSLGSVGGAFSTILLALLVPGDHVIASTSAPLSQPRLTEHLRTRFGVEIEEVDTSDMGALRTAMKPTTRLLWVETPSRHGLKVTNLAAASQIARSNRALLAVDSSLAGPHVQAPLSLGAHLVLHPLSRLLGDKRAKGAMVVTRQGALHKRIREMSRVLGNRLKPERLPMLPQGISTLALRTERSQENAKDVAEWLASHPQVAWVHHIGLETHPHHELARHQMRGPGPGIAFELRAGKKAALELLPRIPSFEAWADAFGILHLTVGFEDIQDLMEELDEGLKRVKRSTPRALGDE
ncbi:MAG: O-acetylhomoserine sulfhydrylase / O-succinylhomoserine sulfhydrylase [Holophagaceae bacterium]|nr:O-acetylhomoserine sulfhydrylase / O-succinylhomoserine sulfhydrylase [Holophagaceae bacterium]